MMIDTHCHLDIDDYDNIDKVIENMKGNIMIASGCNQKTNERVLELVNNYDNIYGTIGVHPEEIDSNIDSSIEFLENNIENPKIVGIGEIGLDYHIFKDKKDLQTDVFIKQIKLAQKYNKPIVIHSRDAINDTYDILVKYLNGTKAVLHCYSSSIEMAFKFKELGVKFGIGGVLTFNNGKKLQEVVKELELTDLLLETDSPYLAPQIVRGQKNEPHNIIYVAEKIAELKNESLEKVLEVTTENAIKQFDLKI